jgi:hypothetical protein
VLFFVKMPVGHVRYIFDDEPLLLVPDWQACIVQINCWKSQDSKDVVKAPDRPTEDMTALRAAIKAARSGEADSGAVLWSLTRGYSSAARVVSRFVLGVGLASAVFLAMFAVVATGRVRDYILLSLLGLLVVSGATAGLAYRFDVGLVIRGDGSMRREGWGGVSTTDLRAYQRVTVKLKQGSDDAAWSEGTN